MLERHLTAIFIASAGRDAVAAAVAGTRTDGTAHAVTVFGARLASGVRRPPRSLKRSRRWSTH